MTKEEKAEYDKKYYAKNKEKKLTQVKAWQNDNKERVNAQKKVYYESLKDSLYTVYYLKEEHYAGMTTTLIRRLLKHKSQYDRYVEDVEIVGKYKTKAGALKVEAALHAMGYLGRSPRFKKQTLKQLI